MGIDGSEIKKSREMKQASSINETAKKQKVKRGAKAGYVKDNLMKQEKILHTGDIHWFIFVPSGFVMVFSIVLLFNSIPGLSLLFAIMFLISLFFLVKAFLFKMSTEVAVTSKRVIAKMGFISRNTIELNHQKVESLNVDQSIAGRIFGFGTIIVNGTGGGRTPIPSISNPMEFRRKAMETIDNTQA